MKVLSLDAVRAWALCHADCKVINTAQPAEVCPVCGGDGEGAQVRDPWDGCDPRCGVDADYHGLACWWDCEECNGAGFERVAIHANGWDPTLTEPIRYAWSAHEHKAIKGTQHSVWAGREEMGGFLGGAGKNLRLPLFGVVAVVDITASHPEHVNRWTELGCCETNPWAEFSDGGPTVHHWEVGAVHLLPERIQIDDPGSGLWVLPDSTTQQIEQQL